MTTDKITAFTTERERAKIVRERLQRVGKKKEGKYKLKVNSAIFSFSTKKARKEFIDTYKDQIIKQEGVKALNNYTFKEL